jgi:hypothetical protein
MAMRANDFHRGLMDAANADPLRDFALRCFHEGMTEPEAVRLIASPKLSLVPDAIKVRFHNLIRDISRLTS